jgi:DNA-binding XRE family transcriptional regulator
MTKRKAARREYSASVPWGEVRAGILSDPEVRVEYDALKPEFDLIRQLIDLRIKRGLSQRQLAKRAGMQQPSIARLEGGRGGSLRTLRRVAEALDADVTVSLVPRRASSTAKHGKHT